MGLGCAGVTARCIPCAWPFLFWVMGIGLYGCDLATVGLNWQASFNPSGSHMKILLAVDGSPFTKRMLAYLATHDDLLSVRN